MNRLIVNVPAITVLALSAVTSVHALAQTQSGAQRPGATATQNTTGGGAGADQAGPASRKDDERFEPGETVRDRPQPQYDPIGVRLGAFTLYPSIALKETYDSNIFFQDDNEVDDFITTVSPVLSARSDWSRHEMNAEIGADILTYAENPDENITNIVGNVGGRIDILRDLTLELGGAANLLHEERGSPDDVNGDEPTPFTQLEADALFRYRPGRYLGELGFSYVGFDYDDVDRTGGTKINNDDRDRDEFTLSGKAGYEIVPEYVAFIRGEIEQRAYRDGLDDNGLDRDSLGYRIEIGTDLDLSGIIVGDIGVGYQQREYEDSQLNDISGVSANANVFWHITPLTTFYGLVARRITETTIAGASGAVTSEATLGVDHELLRNLLLGASIKYTLSDYRGIDREDDTYDIALTADYKLNPMAEISGSIGYDERFSTIDVNEYRHVSAFISLKLSL